MPNRHPDWPVWSAKRLGLALRFWLWLTVEGDFDIPFWQTLRYHHRPQAAAEAGKPWLG